jgi:hypothetical protein
MPTKLKELVERSHTRRLHSQVSTSLTEKQKKKTPILMLGIFNRIEERFEETRHSRVFFHFPDYRLNK